MTQAVMTQEQKILEPKSEFSSHERGDSRWTHAADKTKSSALGWAVFLTFTFSAIELVGAYGVTLLP